MPKICYIEKKFTTASRSLITKANEIIREYSLQGFRLTLRQLYYQFVARDWIENSQRSYKRLGSVIGDARNAGLVDWYAIEDRTRNVRALNHWDHPSDILRACAGQFQLDLWKGQAYRPEVWIEKDALVGVFEPICQELDVSLFSCRGYTSQSEMWTAAQRVKSNRTEDQRSVILHFGDYDPSGIDMSRDICDRLELYSGEAVHFERLALNRDQVDRYGPPPNPAKVTDSRFANYVRIHGGESWELDALEPAVLADLVRENVLDYRADGLWNEAVERQQAARNRLQVLADEWED